MKRSRFAYVVLTLALIAASAAIAAQFLRKRYDEPALTGKIVDATTKKPIEGAVVYGYYATQGGTFGGGRALVQMVKSFEAQTNAEGVFELPAWKSEPVKGKPMALFPMFVAYAPGYEMRHEQMASIREWVPYADRHDVAKIEPSGRINWLHLPHELKPVTNERDRYAALNDSSVGLQFIGECGWEAYSKTLLVRHNEMKSFMTRVIPQENLDKDGYLRSGKPAPDIPFGNFFQRTVVDQLLIRYDSQRLTWGCKNPQIIFNGAKQ